MLVEFDHTRLEISGDEIPDRLHWAYSDLRERLDQAGSQSIIVQQTGNEARLLIDDKSSADWLRNVSHDLANPDNPPGSYHRLAISAGVALASVFLILFVIIPALSNTLAALIPIDREIALGKGSVRQIERILTLERNPDLTCSSTEGDLALAKMSARLSAQFDSPYPIDVRVFDHEMINAFAVPGGQIILFKGLIDAAGTPEEVAGVLGHEMGHVIHRDPTRLALRSAGSVGILGMLVGDFAGGAATLVLAEQLIAANYAQEAEAGADVFATEVLADAELPSKPFAEFFDKLDAQFGGDDEDENDFLSHLASHPELRKRADAARRADTIGDRDFTPVLTKDEWNSLRAICDDNS